MFGKIRLKFGRVFVRRLTFLSGIFWFIRPNFRPVGTQKYLPGRSKCRLTPQCEFAALNFKFLVLFSDYEILTGKSHVIALLFDFGSPVSFWKMQENISKLTFYAVIPNAGQELWRSIYSSVPVPVPLLLEILSALCTIFTSHVF